MMLNDVISQCIILVIHLNLNCCSDSRCKFFDVEYNILAFHLYIDWHGFLYNFSKSLTSGNNSNAENLVTLPSGPLTPVKPISFLRLNSNTVCIRQALLIPEGIFVNIPSASGLYPPVKVTSVTIGGQGGSSKCKVIMPFPA